VGSSVRDEGISNVGRDGRGGPRTLIEDANNSRVPRWSPDGKVILFYSNRSVPAARRGYNAWTIRPFSGILQMLTQIGSVAYPLWSPRGDRLVFTPAFGTPGVDNAATIDLTKSLAERLPQPLPREPHGYSFA